MNWKIFFLKFFRNLILGIILGVVLLGALGYFLAGKDGMINMAYWGLVLGLIGGFSTGLGLIFEARFWEDGKNVSTLPEWNWFIRKSKEEKPRN